MTDAEQERAAIVAWLRRQGASADRRAMAEPKGSKHELMFVVGAVTALRAAELIEVGEHLQSEEPE